MTSNTQRLTRLVSTAVAVGIILISRPALAQTRVDGPPQAVFLAQSSGGGGSTCDLSEINRRAQAGDPQAGRDYMNCVMSLRSGQPIRTRSTAAPVCYELRGASAKGEELVVAIRANANLGNPISSPGARMESAVIESTEARFNGTTYKSTYPSQLTVVRTGGEVGVTAVGTSVEGKAMWSVALQGPGATLAPGSTLPASLPEAANWTSARAITFVEQGKERALEITSIARCGAPKTCEVPGGSFTVLPNFDSNDPNYHCYHYRNEICKTSDVESCNPSNIGKFMRLYPAPRLKCTVPVWDNEEDELASASTLSWLNEWIAFAFFDANFITYSVKPDGTEIVNRTRKGAHMFDPGWVDRKLVLDGGTYYIVTTGSGVGKFTPENVEGAYELWKILDGFISDSVKGKPFEPRADLPFCH